MSWYQSVSVGPQPTTVPVQARGWGTWPAPLFDAAQCLLPTLLPPPQRLHRASEGLAICFVRGLAACLMPAHPRPLSLAGHAADVLGDTLYVAGGGNNTSGCTDLVSLDLSPLSQANGEAKPLQWAVVAQSEARAPTASEGLSMVTSPSSR